VAGANPAIWRSTDMGSQWTLVKNTASGTGGLIHAVIAVSDLVYLATSWGPTPNQTDIYRSTDGGTTWAVTQTIASLSVWTMLSLGNGVVLMGTHGASIGQIYRSTDSGVSFTSVLTVGTTTGGDITSLTQLDNKVIALSGPPNEMAYVSTDDGLTWAAAGAMTTGYHVHNAAAVDAHTLVGVETNATSTSKARRFTYHG
jgi:hypothetical protein